MTPNARSSLLAALLAFAGPWAGRLCPASCARADVVETLAGRLEGGVAFRADGLEVGGKSVRWDDVVTVVRAAEGTAFRPPHMVRLTSGDAWAVEILSLTGKQLAVHFPLTGDRTIDLGLVAGLEFLPGLRPRPDLKAMTLYREEGEPIPGSLLWIDGSRIAIDSPLGAITLAREGAARYLFGTRGSDATPTAAPQPSADEVRLADGSVLRGAVKLAADGVEIEHPILGKVAVRASALRSVLRRQPTVHFLTEAAPKTEASFPLVASPAPPPELVSLPEGGACLLGLLVEPKTILRYPLPVPAGRKAVFRAMVGPEAGSRGDVVVRIAALGRGAETPRPQPLFEKEFAAAAAWEQVSVEVPQGSDLMLEVDFGARLRFPCGVVLGDPIVLTQ